MNDKTEKEINFTEREKNQESQEERFKKAAEAAVKREEEHLGEVVRFDFKEPGLDYSSDEIGAVLKLREEFKQVVLKSEDDPDKMLDILAEKGIDNIKDSKYLKLRAKKTFLGVASLAKELMKEPSGVGAVFMTPEQALRKASQEKNEQVKAELEKIAQSKGMILLDKEPVPKSIFHESCHAMQYLNGMDMDAENDITRAKRELEANWTLIKTKEEDGLLKSVSRLSHDVKKTRIGDTIVVPRIVYHANDIAYESKRFRESNLPQLRQAVATREQEGGLSDARKKIEEIKKQDDENYVIFIE